MCLRAGLWFFSHHIPHGKGRFAVVHGCCPAKSWEKCIIRWFLKLLYLKWAHVWGRRMGDSSYSYALYTASVCRWSRRLWDDLLLYYDVTPGVHITHNTIVGVIKNIVSRELFSLECIYFHRCVYQDSDISPTWKKILFLSWALWRK